MSISNAAAQQIYQNAHDSLSRVVSSRKATVPEKAAARRKRDLLDAQFIGQQLADIESRTALFEKFVDEMEKITAKLEGNSLVGAVRNMREITDSAAGLLDGAEPSE